MKRRAVLLASGLLLIAAVAALGVRYVRAIRPEPVAPDIARYRQDLFDMLRPVRVANCRLQRFGEANDGGYLMCGNLLEDVEAGYSYGIDGYDKWGCDISTAHRIPVHQYDCFNTERPACPAGSTIFHEACVGGRPEVIDGRPFDTVQNHLAANGNAASRIVLKIDVEGAEWDTILAMPDETLGRIDQMAVEFHWQKTGGRWASDPRYPRVIARLRQFFEIAHLHFNNWSCTPDLAPFTAWAYEVLFVNKRLAVVDRAAPAGGLHPADTPSGPSRPDCQPAF